MYIKDGEFMGDLKQLPDLNKDNLLENLIQQGEPSDQFARIIQSVGFTQEKNPQNILFECDKPILRADGTVDIEYIEKHISQLSLVPIPTLNIDDVNVLFDMEVHERTSDGNERPVASITGVEHSDGVAISFKNKLEEFPENRDAEYHIHMKNATKNSAEELVEMLDTITQNAELGIDKK